MAAFPPDRPQGPGKGGRRGSPVVIFIEKHATVIIFMGWEGETDEKHCVFEI